MRIQLVQGLYQMNREQSPKHYAHIANKEIINNHFDISSSFILNLKHYVKIKSIPSVQLYDIAHETVR